MKNRMLLRTLSRTALLGLSLGLVVPASLAQETPTAHAVVTAITPAKEGSTTIPKSSITAFVGGKRQDVSSWIPLRGSRAGLQLVFLLDDASRTSISLQFGDIRKFIEALPPTTEIAIGYMRNGTTDIVQNFTTDHAAAAKTLRVPLGMNSINGSPYFCIQDLLRRWPPGDPNLRREIVMVTDGVDRYTGVRYDPENPYVKNATDDAQKAGVLIYSIYYTGVGRIDQTGYGQDSGQNYLIQFSRDTGGESYYMGYGNPVSFAPFLDDIQRKLQNQYELSLAVTPKKGLEPLKVKTNAPKTKLEAPSQVLIRDASGGQ